MEGGLGSDKYYYNTGDGHDTIFDFRGIFSADPESASFSDVFFGPGILPSSVFAAVNGAGLAPV